jgi:hypothetical protein
MGAMQQMEKIFSKVFPQIIEPTTGSHGGILEKNGTCP